MKEGGETFERTHTFETNLSNKKKIICVLRLFTHIQI